MLTLWGLWSHPIMKGVTTMETQVINGAWIIAGAMKADKDSTESKAFRLKVMFKDVPQESVVLKALEPIKIQWVNGQGRKNYESFEDNQLIEIDFKAPARAPQVDPREAVAATLAGMTEDEQKAYIDELLGLAIK